MRWFTANEVDALIPRLELLFARIYAMLADLVDQRRIIEAAGLPILPEELGQHAIPADLEPTVSRYLELVPEVAAELSVIPLLGGRVRDLDLGLVDFPALHLGRTVFLCWRYGEKVVSAYHEPDEGYAQRHPLSPGRTAIAASQPN